MTHSGILGQKWGIRRYQNEDGSLTPEGRLHYGVGEERRKSRFQMARDRENYKVMKNKIRLESKLEKRRSKLEEKSKESKTKGSVRNLSNLSDDELRKRVDRLRLENEYTERVNRAHPKSQFRQNMSAIGWKVAAAAATKITSKGIEKLIDAAISGEKGKAAGKAANGVLSEELKDLSGSVGKDTTDAIIKEVGSEKIIELKFDEDPFKDWD